MATKTKGTNAKIKELKGIKPEKIDQNELNNLQATIRTTDKLTDDVGRLELQKYALLKAMEGIQENISDIRKSFVKKYGTDNINIQTGEIAYPDETPNTQENGETDRKISVGKDYKNDAMHYAVGQEVYGGHTICDIIEEENKFSVYIKKNKDVLPWKDFNKNMAVSVEYNLEY